MLAPVRSHSSTAHAPVFTAAHVCRNMCVWHQYVRGGAFILCSAEELWSGCFKVTEWELRWAGETSVAEPDERRAWGGVNLAAKVLRAVDTGGGGSSWQVLIGNHSPIGSIMHFVTPFSESSCSQRQITWKQCCCRPLREENQNTLYIQQEVRWSGNTGHLVVPVGKTQAPSGLCRGLTTHTLLNKYF